VTNCNVERDRVTDFAASVLPVPSGYWSIFALLSADDPGFTAHRSVSRMGRNIVPDIAGSLTDAHNATLPPPDADIDEALRLALARLDSDIDARTGDPPWARQAGGPASSPPRIILTAIAHWELKHTDFVTIYVDSDPRRHRRAMHGIRSGSLSTR
jgi:hypothetical protein